MRLLFEKLKDLGHLDLLNPTLCMLIWLPAQIISLKQQLMLKRLLLFLLNHRVCLREIRGNAGGSQFGSEAF